MLAPVFVFFVFVLPMVVVALAAFVKYPFEIQGNDRKIAIKEFLDDVGFDFYFAVLVTLTSVTVDKFGVNIPAEGFVPILLYFLGAVILTRFYKVEWATRFYHSTILWGIIVGILGLSYSLYTAWIP